MYLHAHFILDKTANLTRQDMEPPMVKPPSSIAVLAALASLTILPHAGAEDLLERSYAAGSMKSLVLASAAGDVTIRPTGSGQAVVRATKQVFGAGCHLDMTLKDGELRVESRALATGATCKVAFEITLPRSAGVDVELGSGNLALEGVHGPLRYKVGAGDTRLSRLAPPSLEGRTGAGNLAVESCELTTAQLKIGAGTAAITLSRAPDKGRLDVHLGTGNALISLPRNARVKSSFRAGLGTLTNEFVSTANGFEISGTAGTGDMTIRRL
jgi:hypothetical protein